MDKVHAKKDKVLFGGRCDANRHRLQEGLQSNCNYAARWTTGRGLPSENELRRLIGVSRTTVRKVLQELVRRELVTVRNGIRTVGREVDENDCYPDAETTPRAKHVEQQFMEWMLRGDTRPGTSINELELARQFGVATNGIREFLIRFSRFGLIEKRPNTGWLFKGFTEDFALSSCSRFG